MLSICEPSMVDLINKKPTCNGKSHTFEQPHPKDRAAESEEASNQPTKCADGGQKDYWRRHGLASPSLEKSIFGPVFIKDELAQFGDWLAVKAIETVGFALAPLASVSAEDMPAFEAGSSHNATTCSGTNCWLRAIDDLFNGCAHLLLLSVNLPRE